MNLNRFTEKAQEAIVSAQERAQRAGNPEITGLHLLAALLEQQGGIVPALLPLVNVDPNDLRRRVQQDLTALPRVYAPREPASAGTQNAQRSS
jgi:ATP-dependent Clp protease ATP-binding subunit ClpB